MTGRTDLSSIARACHSLVGSDQQWLEGISNALRPLMDRGQGVAAWTFRLDQVVADELPVGVDPELGQAMHSAATLFPRQMAYRFLLGARAKSICERLQRTAPLDEHPAGAEAGFAKLAIRDFRALTMLDESGIGVGLTAPADRVLTTPRSLVFRLVRVGRHVLAGLRLRRSLGPVDAVFASDGTLLHAAGAAREREHQDALRVAVKTFDRVCSDRGNAETDDALAAWQALVSGRWSLIESFESDGRRYLVAKRNSPVAAEHAAVSPLEAQALLLRAQGFSYKLTAHELGLSVAAAHQLVQSGKRKLGIRSETELPALMRAGALTGIESRGGSAG